MKVRIRTALAVVAVLALGAVALTGCGSTQHHRRRDLVDRGRAGSGERRAHHLGLRHDGQHGAGVGRGVRGGQPERRDHRQGRRLGQRHRGAHQQDGRLRQRVARHQARGDRTQAKANGVNPVTTEVAKDGVVVIVNTGNTVADISKDELGKIYRGEITNWKDLGGADAEIVLLGRDSSSGTYGFIQEEVVGKDKLYAKSMRNLQSSQAIVDEVAKNPNAIGYVGLGYESRIHQAAHRRRRRRVGRHRARRQATRCLAR